jgi:hypothetical protein
MMIHGMLTRLGSWFSFNREIDCRNVLIACICIGVLMNYLDLHCNNTHGSGIVREAIYF